jgi:hypothetical protein
MEIYPSLVAARDDAARMKAERDRFINALLGTQTHIETVYQWMKMEHVYAENAQNQDMHEVVSEIMLVVVEARERLFGFRESELWNFALYLVDSDNNVLMPFWREHHSELVISENGGRTWPVGQGHVGLAYTRKEPF